VEGRKILGNDHFFDYGAVINTYNFDVLTSLLLSLLLEMLLFISTG